MTKQFQCADSGVREEQGTGMVRDSRAGKGRFDLLTPLADRRVAKWSEMGAEKYNDRNWEIGTKFSRFLDSAKRHINAYETIALYLREGISCDLLPDDIDPNEDHLAAAQWNLSCIMHLEITHPEMNDLEDAPKPAAVTPVVEPPERNELFQMIREKLGLVKDAA
jgi:hypothetical protein